MRVGRLVLATFVSLSIAQTATAATITFSQSDWPGGAVTVNSFGSLYTGGAVIDQASGGNPGSYVTFRSDHGAGNYFAWTGLLVNAWVYDPSVSGAITSIDFGADVLPGSGIGTAVFQPLIAQGGNLFFAAQTYLPASGWVNSAFAGGTSATFAWLNPVTATWSFALQPNFTASGGPITFGYGSATNNLGASAGSDFYSYDNVYITLHTANTTPAPAPVPEPATLWMLGSGLIVLAARLRRRVISKY